MSRDEQSALLVTPLRIERAALGHGAVAVGAGPRRAGAAADRLRRLLAAGWYERVLVAGVAGGLRAGQEPGDLVLSTTITGPDGSTLDCPDATDLAAALAARIRPHQVHSGPIVDAGAIVAGPERAVLARTGAIAVDAESARLAAVAARAGLPVLVVRALSDTPRHPLRSYRIVRNGLTALRSLRAAGGLLADWTGSADPAGAPTRTEEIG
jgi:4-hydroxy-3-methylbut-2-en-1-yl diphosphate reductase